MCFAKLAPNQKLIFRFSETNFAENWPKGPPCPHYLSFLTFALFDKIVKGCATIYDHLGATRLQLESQWLILQSPSGERAIRPPIVLEQYLSGSHPTFLGSHPTFLLRNDWIRLANKLLGDSVNPLRPFDPISPVFDRGRHPEPSVVT